MSGRIEKEPCPCCGALPCDWCQDPHQYHDFLCMVMADIRAAIGVGEKPMASELPTIIGELLGTSTDMQDKLSAAITLLYTHEIIASAERDKARERLGQRWRTT